MARSTCPMCRRAGARQFATFTFRTAALVAPAASRTVTVTARVPFGVPVVIHGSEMRPFDALDVVATALPSTPSVYVFEPAAACSTQIVNHAVPLTVAPSPGLVNEATSGARPFWTLSFR